MRLWSIHPKYLDSKGLVALWRETLLAKKVLEGNTKGYINHPQLERFKLLEDSCIGINNYLKSIWIESLKRNYNFDKSKFINFETEIKIPVTKGQVEYEFYHLLKKLQIRDFNRYVINSSVVEIILNDNFYLIPGGIEKWERLK